MYHTQLFRSGKLKNHTRTTPVRTIMSPLDGGIICRLNGLWWHQRAKPIFVYTKPSTAFHSQSVFIRPSHSQGCLISPRTAVLHAHDGSILDLLHHIGSHFSFIDNTPLLPFLSSSSTSSVGHI